MNWFLFWIGLVLAFIWIGLVLAFIWIGYCGFFQRSSALIADCPTKVVRFF
jgi:hypothetical protein